MRREKTREGRKNWIYRARPFPKGTASFIHSFIRSAPPGAGSYGKCRDLRSTRRLELFLAEQRPEAPPRKRSFGPRPSSCQSLTPLPQPSSEAPPGLRLHPPGACATRPRDSLRPRPAAARPPRPRLRRVRPQLAAAPGELPGSGRAGRVAASAGGGRRAAGGNRAPASSPEGAGTQGRARARDAGVAA